MHFNEDLDLSAKKYTRDKNKSSEEKVKMLNEKLYDPDDPLLSHDRRVAKSLEQVFNNLDTRDPLYLQALKQALGTFPEDAWIEAPFRIDYGYNIHLGANVYINANCTFLDPAPIHIGANTKIGPDTKLYTPLHPLLADERNSGLEYAEGINIGKNVWIAGNVTILPGVSIGDNSVIGAGSIVTKDIPSNVLAVGNPCKVLREIGPEDKLMK